ncbi:MAG: SDR family NAD(P)-dependent oxidoreductase [Bacteroidales bacterium]|nr:SDR family NAD(P)-dependent oxidoreductase [Bacteroidales bacterium]
MKLNNNTVLVTGGSSGIGLELSKALIKKGNKVIICGRSNEKLAAAKNQEPSLITYQCDLSNSRECIDFARKIATDHPDLNTLINNAAIVNKIDFINDENALELAENEYQTNLIAPIRLINLLYKTISANDSSSIINITTGLIYAPRVIYPFYNSSKSALHSFTQTLRIRLKNENTRVVEVMFPAVDTPWHKGAPPKIAISAAAAVSEMLNGIGKGHSEIKVGGAKILYLISRIAPLFALKKVNEIR